MNIEHIEVLQALANGEAIEWQIDHDDNPCWLEPSQHTNPISSPHLRWRIKPKPEDYNPFKACLDGRGGEYTIEDNTVGNDFDRYGLSFESFEDAEHTEQVLLAMQAYRKAHIESFKDNPPNWTDPYQSKWALVIDGSELTAREVFVGVQYPYIFSTRADALRFVDGVGYDNAMNMLRGW